MGLKAGYFFFKHLLRIYCCHCCSNKIPSESCFLSDWWAYASRQDRHLLNYKFPLVRKKSTLAPSASALCGGETASQGSRAREALASSITMTLNGVDLLPWLSSLPFSPPERMCWYTPHRQSQTKGTNNSYRVKDAITLFEKVCEWPLAAQFTLSQCLELLVAPLN